MKKLPNKPSELLKLALTDLELVEKDPRYRVDMGNWHEPINGGEVCAVCLAGAVMAKEWNFPLFSRANPDSFLRDLENKLRAIDYFRQGYFDYAFNMLGTTRPGSIPGEYYEGDDFFSAINGNYSYDSPYFFNHMCTIIGILEAEGL